MWSAGPDWLIVRIQSMDASGENPPLAELIWGLMQQHLTHRLVLELDQVPVLNSFLIEQLRNCTGRFTSTTE